MTWILFLTLQGFCRKAQDNFHVLQALLLDDMGFFFRYRVLFNADLMSLNVLKEEQLSHTLLYVEGKNVKAAFS